MVGIAQLVEHLIVVQGAAGSSPVTHPKNEKRPCSGRFLRFLHKSAERGEDTLRREPEISRRAAVLMNAFAFRSWLRLKPCNQPQ